MNDFREYKGYCEATYGDIMHFGILGMHWGIRRYQNPDGTLTAAGKKRYDKYMKKAEAEDKVVEVFKDEKPKLGSYNNVGYNAKVVASKKAEKFRKKAEKYGTEYKEEKTSEDEQRKKAYEEKLKKKIDEANKIDISSIWTDDLTDDNEVSDKFNNAVKKDTYDLNFLEMTQNNYDDMPESSANKQRLKDYVDYLNAQKASKMVIDKHDRNSKKELDEAADLGLKAYNKIHDFNNDAEPGDESSRFWFTYEDQTIGYTEVADLCKKFYDEKSSNVRSAKSDVLKTLKSLDPVDYTYGRDLIDAFSGNNEGLWDLQYFSSYNIGNEPDSYAQQNKSKSGKTVGEDYIDAIFAILQSEGKLKHGVDSVYAKFGLI